MEARAAVMDEENVSSGSVISGWDEGKGRQNYREAYSGCSVALKC